MQTTLISFYGGAPYYKEAAERMIARCVELGIPHYIVEQTIGLDEAWGDICRRKIRFYKEALDRFPDGVLWVDADTEITRAPEFVGGPGIDFGSFLRGFTYLKDFDVARWARFFAPCFLYFGPTPTARAFVDYMVALERDFKGDATDDYFLQEAWKTFHSELSVQVFPPKYVIIDGKGNKDEACFAVGYSGNVKTFKGDLAQHTADALTPARVALVLRHLATEAKKAGRVAEHRALKSVLETRQKRLVGGPGSQPAAVPPGNKPAAVAPGNKPAAAAPGGKPVVKKKPAPPEKKKTVAETVLQRLKAAFGR